MRLYTERGAGFDLLYLGELWVGAKLSSSGLEWPTHFLPVSDRPKRNAAPPETSAVRAVCAHFCVSGVAVLSKKTNSPAQDAQYKQSKKDDEEEGYVP
jgi:hypothetical protein